MEAHVVTFVLLIGCLLSAIGVYIHRMHKLELSLLIVMMCFTAFAAGGMLTGYDFTNDCSYKERAQTQTKLHGLAMSMLNQYFIHDPDFFLDVISESEEYSEYNAEVEGDWESFGLK